MTDRDKKTDPDYHGSFEDISVGIGQNADGTITSFPLSELPERQAALREQEESTTYAMEQMENGFPDEQEDDLSDLDDLDEVLGE